MSPLVKMSLPKFSLFVIGAWGLILIVALEGGCVLLGPSASKEVAINSNAGNISSFERTKDKESKKLIVLLLIVNETGKDILLKALLDLDKEELFVQYVASEIKRVPGAAPPFAGKYPMKELKVEIRKDARILEVKETYSERRAVYDITNFSKKAGGFRINVREDGISFNQDYFPIR